MKLIKDLGSVKFTAKSGNTYSKPMGIYECSICLEPFEAQQGNVRSGRATKCRSCATRITKTIHGDGKTKTFSNWTSMKYRCSNANYKKYCDYGGRGISVCDEWKESYVAYRDHIATLDNAFKAGYSVDRIDNEGNYEPGNVRWSTAKEQANNRRNNVNF